MISRTVWITLLVHLLAAPVLAQSLAALARQEAERRKTVTPGRVYTNADLPAPEPARETPVMPVVGPAAAGPPIEVEFAPEPAILAAPEAAISMPADKRDEAFWRTRATALRTRLEQLGADISAIQSRTLLLRQALAAPDQAPALASDLQVATEDLNRYQQDFRHLEREWMHFEKLARDAGIPAEWLR